MIYILSGMVEAWLRAAVVVENFHYVKISLLLRHPTQQSQSILTAN